MHAYDTWLTARKKQETEDSPQSRIRGRCRSFYPAWPATPRSRQTSRRIPSEPHPKCPNLTRQQIFLLPCCLWWMKLCYLWWNRHIKIRSSAVTSFFQKSFGTPNPKHTNQLYKNDQQRPSHNNVNLNLDCQGMARNCFELLYYSHWYYVGSELLMAVMLSDGSTKQSRVKRQPII